MERRANLVPREDAVEGHQVEVHVEVQAASEALDEGDCALAGPAMPWLRARRRCSVKICVTKMRDSGADVEPHDKPRFAAAHAGFDLHAGVHIRAGDDEGPDPTAAVPARALLRGRGAQLAVESTRDPHAAGGPGVCGTVERGG